MHLNHKRPFDWTDTCCSDKNKRATSVNIKYWNYGKCCACADMAKGLDCIHRIIGFGECAGVGDADGVGDTDVQVDR